MNIFRSQSDVEPLAEMYAAQEPPMSKHASFGIASCSRGVAQDIDCLLGWLSQFYILSPSSLLNDFLEVEQFQISCLSSLLVIFRDLVETYDVLEIGH